MNILPRTATALLGGSAVLFLAIAAVHAQESTYVPVRAVLRAKPSADTEQRVHLPLEGGTLGLFLDASIGDIVQYRIDLNTAQDSDGDGITDNDADNSYHSSFRSGGTFPVSVRPASSEERREILLYVADALGNTSVARLTILFDGALLPETVLEISLQEDQPEEGEEEGLEEEPSGTQEILITKDRDTLKTGEEFTLTVQGAPENTALYLWDLQRDGQTDTQSASPSVLLAPDAPGVLPVRVTFRDATGRSLGTASAEFTVEPAAAALLGDALRIDVTIQELTVLLRPRVDTSLDLLKLEPTWVFGDGERSYLLESQHTYKRAGTYKIMLSLRTLTSQRVVATAETSITVSGSAVPKGGAGGVLSSILAPFTFLFKIVFGVLLLLSFAAGAVFLWLMLQAKKEQIPLGEIVQRFKKRFSGETEEIIPSAVPEVSAVVDRAGKKALEPAPMKLEKEEQKRKEPAPPPKETPAVEPPPKEAPVQESPPPAGEAEAMPPWLSGAPDVTPQAPSAPPATVPTAPPTPPSELSSAPSWLEQGLSGAEAEEKKQVEEGIVSKPLTQASGTTAQPQKKERTPQEQERLREKRRRYKRNKRERARKAHEAENEKKDQSDEPIAFIKAEDIQKQEESSETKSPKEDEKPEDQGKEPKKAA